MSDLTDTARMDEAKRMMASQANTSVFLMDAELTARNRYETETDIEEQTAAFVDGVAWCAQHLHDPGGHVQRILEEEHVTDPRQALRDGMLEPVPDGNDGRLRSIGPQA